MALHARFHFTCAHKKVPTKMNYALLRKYLYTGDKNKLDQVFAQAANLLALRKSPGCSEVLLYLADSRPNLFFAMSLWFSLAELERIFKRAPTLEQVNQVRLVEQKVFELIEDYRVLDTPIEASFIRLIRLAGPLKIEQAVSGATLGKNKAKALDGYIGGWTGLCMSDPRLLLTRADWASHATFRAFLEDEAPDSAVKWYFSHGVGWENASYNLRAVVALLP
jgi:heme-degrading monooxygenase HmoA